MKNETTVLYQGHGSLRLTSKNGTVVYVDPYAGEGYGIPADIILVTHGHSDHTRTDLPAKKEDCRIITYKDALVDGEYLAFDLCGITIEAVEAYNKNHDSDACVGYIITLDGVKVYVSGDTSKTEQMSTFAEREIDYAFLCCDGVYNMDLEEAAECAEIIKAKYSIPYHMIPGALFSQELAESFEADNREILYPGECINLTRYISDQT